MKNEEEGPVITTVVASDPKHDIVTVTVTGTDNTGGGGDKDATVTLVISPGASYTHQKATPSTTPKTDSNGNLVYEWKVTWPDTVGGQCTATVECQGVGASGKADGKIEMTWGSGNVAEDTGDDTIKCG
ncbi:MAG: hypothetical protein AAFZ87_00145 [Planctomycetota bacterium]